MHDNGVIMSATASQITGVTIVCLIVCSVADQREHQSSVSLAFVWGIHRWPVYSPHKGPVTRKIFPFDDVIVRKRDFARFGYPVLLYYMCYWPALWAKWACRLSAIVENIVVLSFACQLTVTHLKIGILDLQVSCSDLTKWMGASLVAPVMTARWVEHVLFCHFLCCSCSVLFRPAAHCFFSDHLYMYSP